MENHKMKTLSECMTSLKKHGFEEEFFVTEDGRIRNYNSEKTWCAEDVKIENFYRFEGQSDPWFNPLLIGLSTFHLYQCTHFHFIFALRGTNDGDFYADVC